MRITKTQYDKGRKKVKHMKEQSTILEMFSGNLNRIMAEKRMSNTELANGVGVTPTTIGNWRNGKKFPRMDKVDKICNFLQISRGDLIKVEDTSRNMRPHYYDDPEITTIANELKSNHNMRTLLDVSRNLSEEDIQTVVMVAKSLSRKGGD